MDLSVAAAITAVTLTVYLATLLPGIDSWGDISKWQFLGKVLGTSHPTGYPLYLFLTHAISRVGVLDLAWRINAFSAVCGAASCASVYLLARETGAPVLLGAIGSLVFAFSPAFWSQSVVAEVYTLNALFVSTVLLFLLRWRRTRRRRDFLIAGMLCSLSLAHHLTIVCLLPGIIVFVLVTDRRVCLQPRVFIPLVGVLLFAISMYLYPLWRTRVGAPHLEYRVRTIPELVSYVSGAQYRQGMFSYSLDELLRNRMPLAAKALWQELPVLVLFAPIGLTAIRDVATRLLFGLSLLAYIAFNVEYAISDIEIYFIPVALLLTVLAIRGWDSVWGRPAGRWRSLARNLGMLALVLYTFTSSLPSCDASGRTAFHQLVESRLKAMPEGALLVMDGWNRDYAYFEGTLYFLLGEGRGAGRLFVVTPENPAGISRYLQGKGRLYSDVMAAEVPPGLPAYVMTRSPIAESQPFGLRARMVEPDLYRLEID